MELIAAVFGFFAPFLTEAFKIFQKKQDNAHELSMMRIQIEAKAQEHVYRMEEINANADIAEMSTLRAAPTSFGVQLIDAAANKNFSKWMIGPVFYLFAILDFISSLVRPAITYAAFTFYATVKWAQFEHARTYLGSNYSALLQIWTTSDMSIVILVLSYWFGQRAAKAAFGGSANTITKGS